jgi:hypothetical protein
LLPLLSQSVVIRQLSKARLIGGIAQRTVRIEMGVNGRPPIRLSRAGRRVNFPFGDGLSQFRAQNRGQLAVARALPHKPFRNQDICGAAVKDFGLRRADRAKKRVHSQLRIGGKNSSADTIDSGSRLR